ncbi:hypothetical protein RIF29_32157 [Crotalaria pallida]|uniref:Uncharacterized protein n=1 Tax=Crotalaria pallida TaxID=3830 RepID=A0AAN9EHU5_CROPI
MAEELPMRLFAEIFPYLNLSFVVVFCIISLRLSHLLGKLLLDPNESRTNSENFCCSVVECYAVCGYKYAMNLAPYHKQHTFSNPFPSFLHIPNSQFPIFVP